MDKVHKLNSSEHAPTESMENGQYSQVLEGYPVNTMAMNGAPQYQPLAGAQVYSAGTGDVQYINDDDIVCCCCFTPELGFKIMFAFALFSFANPISFVALLYYIPWIRKDYKKTRAGLVTVMKMNYIVLWVLVSMNAFTILVLGVVMYAKGGYFYRIYGDPLIGLCLT